MKALPPELLNALHQIDMNHRRPVSEVKASAAQVEALAKVFPEWEYEIIRTADNMVFLSEGWEKTVKEGVLA